MEKTKSWLFCPFSSCRGAENPCLSDCVPPEPCAEGEALPCPSETLREGGAKEENSVLYFVGAPRIELGLSAPKADVLPVYYAPSISRILPQGAYFRFIV